MQSASKRWSPAGTYYMESGVGGRAAKVIYDRAGSSFAEIKTNEWSEAIFKRCRTFPCIRHYTSVIRDVAGFDPFTC